MKTPDHKRRIQGGNKSANIDAVAGSELSNFA